MKKLSLAATTAVSAMLALGPGYALSFDFSSTNTIGGGCLRRSIRLGEAA